MPPNPKQNGRLYGGKKIQNEVSPETEKTQKPKSDTALAILPILAVGGVIFSVVFRSVLFHYAQSFMTDSREFITAKWGLFYDYFEGDFAKMGLAMYVFAVLEYWFVGCLYFIVDITEKPAFLYKYKIQQNSSKIPPEKIKKLLSNVALNHTVYNIPAVIWAYYVLKWRGVETKPSEIPSLQYFLMEVVVYYICVAAVFYYSHRLLHYPPLYKRIHKIHQWTAPIGLATVYCHPVENFLANTLSVIAGPIVMGSHLLPTAVWMVLAQTVAMIGHSGYHFPFIRSPEAHDYHHLKFINNFGPGGIFDRLHSTNIEYRNSTQYSRDRRLWSFTPMYELISDEPK